MIEILRAAARMARGKQRMKRNWEYRQQSADWYTIGYLAEPEGDDAQPEYLPIFWTQDPAYARQCVEAMNAAELA